MHDEKSLLAILAAQCTAQHGIEFRRSVEYDADAADALSRPVRMADGSVIDESRRIAIQRRRRERRDVIRLLAAQRFAGISQKRARRALPDPLY